MNSRSDFRDGDVTLVLKRDDVGVRIGLHALEAWYATGVLIPLDHPAYPAALALQAALDLAGGQK